MRALLVVLDHPPVGGFPHLGKISKEIQIEYLLPIGAVEALDIGILVRFAGLNVQNEHSGGFIPGHEVSTQEFGSVIYTQHIRQAPFAAELLKHPDEPAAGDRGVDLDSQTFPVEVVDDVERPEPFTDMERIAHKVCRPDLVRMLRNQVWLSLPLRQPLLGPAFLVEP